MKHVWIVWRIYWLYNMSEPKTEIITVCANRETAENWVGKATDRYEITKHEVIDTFI